MMALVRNIRRCEVSLISFQGPDNARGISACNHTRWDVASYNCAISDYRASANCDALKYFCIRTQKNVIPDDYRLCPLGSRPSSIINI